MGITITEKSFSTNLLESTDKTIKIKIVYLRYDIHIEDKIGFVNKLKSIINVLKNNKLNEWSIVNEYGTKRFRKHCHVFLDIEKQAEVSRNFFDIESGPPKYWGRINIRKNLYTNIHYYHMKQGEYIETSFKDDIKDEAKLFLEKEKDRHIEFEGLTIGEMRQIKEEARSDPFGFEDRCSVAASSRIANTILPHIIKPEPLPNDRPNAHKKFMDWIIDYSKDLSIEFGFLYVCFPNVKHEFNYIRRYLYNHIHGCCLSQVGTSYQVGSYCVGYNQETYDSPVNTLIFHLKPDGETGFKKSFINAMTNFFDSQLYGKIKSVPKKVTQSDSPKIIILSNAYPELILPDILLDNLTLMYISNPDEEPITKTYREMKEDVTIELNRNPRKDVPLTFNSLGCFKVYKDLLKIK